MEQRAFTSDELKRWQPNGELLPEPKPLPKPYKSFPVDALPEPCRQFVDEASAAIGCDESYSGVPLLAALGGCIGNSN